VAKPFDATTKALVELEPAAWLSPQTGRCA
jgi:hypothetical protein